MKKGCWYCTKCKAEVEPMHVTFWETHDERFGGCGCHMDNGKPDVLDDAIAQRIGGADGELVEALCEEVARLRRVIDALSIQADAHKGLREELRRMRNTTPNVESERPGGGIIAGGSRSTDGFGGCQQRSAVVPAPTFERTMT